MIVKILVNEINKLADTQIEKYKFIFKVLIKVTRNKYVISSDEDIKNLIEGNIKARNIFIKKGTYLVKQNTMIDMKVLNIDYIFAEPKTLLIFDAWTSDAIYGGKGLYGATIHNTGEYFSNLSYARFTERIYVHAQTLREITEDKEATNT